MANIVESYKNRLAIAESVHQRSHNGAKMSAQKKLMIASVLHNTSRFLSEAFNDASATQRADIVDFKKFCLNISTVALPNLILPELMIVQPMSSLSGYVTYLRYTAGTDKGGVEAGDTFNGVYSLGQMTPDRMRYTSAAVSETHPASDIVDGVVTLDWTPVLALKDVVKYTAEGKVDQVFTIVTDPNATLQATQVKLNTEGKLELFADDWTNATEIRIKYFYDNEIIPQSVRPVSLPTLTAKMQAVNLHAHARRIAVYYSQIAAFQAKNDYGYDLGQQLAAQAQGELAYEIDTEGVMLLYKGAEHDKRLDMPQYSTAIAGAISRSQYYEMFTEIIARAKAIIYQRTQKFAPNYMVVAADVLTVLPYLKGWVAAPASVVNGPYFAGTVDGVKVYVSPAMAQGEFFFGVNGSDLQTSAAVYAPYMAIVPTQLLGFADGTMSQGFSTMYDMKLLSTYDAVQKEAGVEDSSTSTKTDVDNGQFSWLLVKGKMIPAEDGTNGLGVFVTNPTDFPVNTKEVQ